LNTLNALTYKPPQTPQPQFLLVFLHGWGADAQDLFPLAPLLELPQCWCLFPNAPFPHPQIPGGRAWYALDSQDLAGLNKSRDLLSHWLISLQAQTGVPLNKTVLGGFSQGGAMSLDVGRELPLAGVFCLSGYLHFHPREQAQPLPPIFMAHGQQDLVVPPEAAQEAKNELLSIGAQIEYREFRGGHEIPPLVIEQVRSFIRNVMEEGPSP